MTSYFKLLPKLGSLLLLSYLIFGFGQNLFAQDKKPICGFDHIHGKAMQENAEYKRIVEANEAAIQKFLKSSKGGRTEATVYKIPCVVHIIHTGGAIGTIYNPTDAVITTMISNMTKAFRNQAPYTSGVGNDIEIEFELAKRSPTCTATTGINRVDGSVLANYAANGVGTGGATDATVKALSIWSNTDYYNIWIVNKIDGADGTMGTFTAGYAFFPGASAAVDGTVMLATQTGSVTTITHELGHALNLFHTFEGSSGVGVCPPNATCATQGDRVCDTAPQDDNPFQCTTNACGAATVLPNYMSYSNCATRDYTAGQSARMRAALETSRSGLISSQALVAPTGTVTAACTPTNTGLSSGIGVTLFKFNTINVSSGHSTADNTNYIDRSCLQQTTVVAGAVVPVQIATSVNASTVKVFIDYNNNGSFADTGEEVFSGISTSTGVGVPPVFDISGNINIPATGITFNTALRMRVVAAGNTPATPTSCSVNTGQAEDYGIIITPAAAPVRPFIISFAPTQAAAGATVTISGLNFNSTMANNQVYFGDLRATVTGVTGTTQLTVNVPAGCTSVSPIVVRNTANGLSFSSYSSNNTKLFTASSTVSCTVSGTSYTNTNSSVGTNPYDLALADMNNDGNLDLITGNSTTNNITIRLGNGNGTYGGATNFPVLGTEPASIAVADFNQDGNLDVATANHCSTNCATTISVLLGTGSGAVGTATTFAAGTRVWNLIAEDVTGDGIIDLITGRYTANQIAIFAGNGDGTFGTATTVAANTPSGLATGDFDNDGDLDLVSCGNFDSNLVNILLNNGFGVFTAAPTPTYAIPSAFRAVVGQFNADAFADIAVTGSTSNVVTILLGNGAGGFTQSSIAAAGTDGYGIAVGDLNGDGKTDLVRGDLSGNNVRVYLGNGDGTFAAPLAVALNSPLAVAVADMNKDGIADIVATDFNNSNVGTMIFGVPPTVTTLNPADNATNINISTTLQVTFNENITKGTGNLVIKRYSDDSVIETFNVATSPQIVVAGAVVTITPTAALPSGVRVYVEIPNTAFKNACGNFYTGTATKDTWDFTTDATVAGTILLVNPLGTGSTKLATVVATDWTNKAYPSLQAALDVAVSGDQIWVKQGTHLPTKDATGNAAPADDRTKTFKIPNGVSVYGGFLATETLLTARNFTTNVTTLSGNIGVLATMTDNSYNVVIIDGNATDTRLDGFTVERGHDDRASSEWGKGIYIISSRAIVANCIVTNNVGVTSGGFYKFGIGITVTGLAAGATPQVQILNSTISNNTGSSGGGGMELRDGTTLVRHCIFKDNSASTDGGVIGTGGAIQLFSNPSTVLNLENSLLINNVANGTGDDGGGAIMIYAGTVNVSNSTIANNSTTGSAGGGIRKSPSTNTNLTVNNSILYGNTSVNSVIANDIQISPGLGGTLVVNNNLVQCPLPAGATGTGNINNNPRFVSATDFSLQTNSPCLNIGDNTLIPAGVTVDLANSGRTFGTAVDMGAYELQAAALAAPVPSVAIAALPAGAICAGTSVTFTATPTNGGTTPAYQWKLNGGNVGTNSTTYTTTTLVNGDVITCEMTPIEICNTYPSNGITTVVNIMYVRTDGNDANSGFANNAAGAKLTLQAAFTAVLDGCTVVLNAGTYNETATLTNKSITLQSVGNPTVQGLVLNGTGKTVTLTGGLNISEMFNLQAGDLASAGNLTLLATATKQAMLIQGTGTNVTGNVNVQRYLRANTGTGGTTSLGYRFVSSPTSNATLTQLSELNPVVNAAFNGAAFPGRTVPFPTVYSYNPTLAGDPAKTFITSPFPEFDKGWVSPATLGENMNVGQGFTVNTSANQVLEITGLLNNGNVNIPVVVGNAASLGYNLVGNPYPSPIKWSSVLAASTGVNDAIYQNMATGQYTGSWASYVGGVGVNGATDTVAVMQGFFVIANAAGSVNFTNATRATTYTNPNSFRTEDGTNNNKNASKNNGLLRLAMTNSANKTDETVVYFADKATANFDKELDAVKFQLNGGNFPNIYTTDNKTEKNTLFSINALPNLTDDLVVPVTVQSWNGGVQKIAMTEKLNFVREVQVFLKDKSTNTLHDFAKGAFEFTATSGVIANRFELVFKPQFTAAELQGDNLNVYPNPSSEVLNISIGDDYKGELTLRLIDVTGREVWTTKAEKTSKIYENSVNLSNLASGTYLLEVSGAKKMVKKIVKN
jgi:hypothetical protein